MVLFVRRLGVGVGGGRGRYGDTCRLLFDGGLIRYEGMSRSRMTLLQGIETDDWGVEECNRQSHSHQIRAVGNNEGERGDQSRGERESKERKRKREERK